MTELIIAEDHFSDISESYDLIRNTENISIRLCNRDYESIVSQIRPDTGYTVKGKLFSTILFHFKASDGEKSDIDVIRKLRNSHYFCKIIVWSSSHKNIYTKQFLNLGANAFLHRNIDPKELIKVIYEVDKFGSTGTYLTDQQKKSFKELDSFTSPDPNKIPSLTRREMEVLNLFSQRLTTKEISTLLFVYPRTIEGHLSNIISKTGVRNNIQLAQYAAEHKMIDPNNYLF